MKRFSAPLLILAVIVSFTFHTPRAFAATNPTRIGTDVGTDFASSNPWTQAITVPTSGQNRVLIVLTAQGGSGAFPIGVTYAGVEMSTTTALSAAQQASGNMFCMANPPTGTNNIVVNYNGANAQGYIVAMTYQDMVQNCASVLDVSGQSSGNPLTADSKAITTTVDGDIVVAWAGIGRLATGITPNAPQTQIATVLGCGANDICFTVSDTPATTAGSITTGYTWTVPSGDDFFAVALKYLAPTASGPTYDTGNLLPWLI